VTKIVYIKDRLLTELWSVDM